MKNKIIVALFLLGIIAGIIICLYPTVNNSVYTMKTQNAQTEFIQNIQSDAADRETVTVSFAENDESRTASGIDYVGLYRAMQLYNIGLQTQQVLSTDSADSFNAYAYGVENGIIGYVNIPKLSVTMPLKIGSDKSILNNGAGVLAGTSLPIGGESTNCVIVAHRGWGGLQLLRHIERLEVGDTVTVDNLFGTLTYKVVGYEIIDPAENNKLMIQQGRDMLTLYTCHPYRVNSHRYIVYCERV